MDCEELLKSTVRTVPPAFSKRMWVCIHFFFFFLSVLVSMCLLSVQLYMLDNFFLKKWSQFLLSLKCQQQTSGFQCKYDDSSCPNYTKLFPHILCYLWGQLRSNSEIASSPWISSHFSQVNTAWKRILRGNFAKYGLEGIAKLFSNGWIEKKKKMFLMCDVRGVYNFPSFTKMLLLLSKFPLCSWVPCINIWSAKTCGQILCLTIGLED